MNGLQAMRLRGRRNVAKARLAVRFSVWPVANHRTKALGREGWDISWRDLGGDGKVGGQLSDMHVGQVPLATTSEPVR